MDAFIKYVILLSRMIAFIDSSEEDPYIHFYSLAQYISHRLSCCLIFSSFNCSQDASMIFVQIGFGFFVEFTLKEALKFIDKKTKLLTQ